MAKLGAAALRRLKAKRQREKGKAEEIQSSSNAVNQGGNVEYEVVPLFLGEDEEKVLASAEFARIAAKFGLAEETTQAMDEAAHAQPEGDQAEILADSAATAALSKKKLKKKHRLAVADLKQAVRTPEVVEWEDTTARDPYLLVFLKSERMSVPVPRHWSQKRKYLAGKRGFVKPPFELPSFIRDTGILEQREAVRKEDATKTLKVRARERMHPKLGRISVDYERLYDAFYKYQTRPPLTSHGALYYEGREFEGRMRERRPGLLSDELRQALGLTSQLMPPPWLHNQQRWGPPPSYPGLRIPGLNAPLPEGAQWGFHPTGWGKPPADLASLLGTDGSAQFSRVDPQIIALLKPVERNLWGEFEPEPEEEEAEGETPEGDESQADLAVGVREVSLEPEQLEYYEAKYLRQSAAAPEPEPDLSRLVDTPNVIELRKRR